MSYLDSGFNENLIREEKSNNIDIVNVNEILDVGAIPVKEFTNALTSVKIINSSNNLIKDVINDKLDTEAKIIKGSFNFGTSGALQIGNYEAGVSGDLKISPNGIVARNSSDDTTFAIDGTTGDATFKGTITAGSVISATITATNIVAGTFGDTINVGNANVKIDGANKRIIINDGSKDRILIGYLPGKF